MWKPYILKEALSGGVAERLPCGLEDMQREISRGNHFLAPFYPRVVCRGVGHHADRECAKGNLTWKLPFLPPVLSERGLQKVLARGFHADRKICQEQPFGETLLTF